MHVPEKEFRKIAPGQNAEVVVDALGGARFVGTISRISPTVDPQTGTFRARVEVPDATRTLKPGMFARVNIVYERRQNALQLPRTAILDADGAAVGVRRRERQGRAAHDQDRASRTAAGSRCSRASRATSRS